MGVVDTFELNPILTGGHIIPTQYYVPPTQISRPCDGSDRAGMPVAFKPIRWA